MQSFNQQFYLPKSHDSWWSLLGRTSSWSSFRAIIIKCYDGRGVAINFLRTLRGRAWRNIPIGHAKAYIINADRHSIVNLLPSKKKREEEPSKIKLTSNGETTRCLSIHTEVTREQKSCVKGFVSIIVSLCAFYVKDFWEVDLRGPWRPSCGAATGQVGACATPRSRL